MRYGLLGLGLLTACALSSGAGAVKLNKVAGGFQQPLAATNAGDGSNRLFVTEQGGKIKIFEGGKTK